MIVLPVVSGSMLFASDIADRAEETLRALDEAIRQAEASGTSLSDEPLLSDVETTIMADLDKGVDEDLAIRQLRAKIKAIESELARQHSGGLPARSQDTIRTLMDKRDELNQLKKELKQLEVASGVDPLSESTDVGKLQKNYEQLIEDRNKMEKELFEMKEEHKEKMTNMRSIFEQQYLQNLEDQGAALVTARPTPGASMQSPTAARISEPNPSVPIDDLENFLREEGVLPSPQPAQTSPKEQPSKFSGLLDDAPAPVKKESGSSSAGLNFIAPVETKPVVVQPPVLPFIKPTVTTQPPGFSVVAEKRTRAVTSPKDIYQPVLPERFLRSLKPLAQPVPPPVARPPVPVAAPPSAPVPAPSALPAPPPVAPPPPVPVPSLEDPLLKVLNVTSVPPTLSEVPSTSTPRNIELPTPDVFESAPELPTVIESTVPSAPIPGNSFNEIEVVEPVSTEDQSLFDILATEPELAELPPPAPLSPSVSPEPGPPSSPNTDFSIFDEAPGLAMPPEPVVPAEPPRPAPVPIPEPIRTPPVVVAPTEPKFLPHLNDKLPAGSLEFYDLPSLRPRQGIPVPKAGVSSEPSSSEGLGAEQEKVSPPIVEIEEAMDTEPPVVPVRPVRKLPLRRKPPASTVVLNIETEVEFLSGGDPRPADYTEFYITTSGFTEIVLNSPELKEFMDKAITGKNISSYAELWARAHKYGYNYPGLSSKIRQTLRKQSIHRVRTDATGKAKVRISRELAQDEQAPEHYLIGVSMLGKVGVVWSQPFYVQDYAGQDIPVVLEGQDAIWLQ